MRWIALIFVYLTLMQGAHANGMTTQEISPISNEQEKIPPSEIASLNKIHLQPKFNYYCDYLKPWRWCNDITFRVAYFYPSSRRFRDIFSGTRVDYQIELSQPIFRCWELWENVSWYPDCGHSLGWRHHSTIDFIPISFGVKYVFCLNRCLQLRLGGGLSYYFLRTSDQWINQKKTCWNHDVGGAFKADIRFMLPRCFHVDIFADYLVLPLNVQNGVNQVGGLKAGAGIGHRF